MIDKQCRPRSDHHRTRRLIRVWTVCLNFWKLRVEWNIVDSLFRSIYSAYTQRQSTHQSASAWRESNFDRASM